MHLAAIPSLRVKSLCAADAFMGKDEAFMDTQREFRGLSFIMGNKETAVRAAEGDIGRIYQRERDRQAARQ